jgi:hypothetical protein
MVKEIAESIFLITFFIFRTNWFSGKSDGQNIIEQGQEAIDQANKIKDTLEKYNCNLVRKETNNEYITNKLNDNIENDSLDESEIDVEEPNNFFY